MGGYHLLTVDVADGLPQGLLLTGRLYEEGAPMRLAYAYEQANDWHTKYPALQT